MHVISPEIALLDVPAPQSDQTGYQTGFQCKASCILPGPCAKSSVSFKQGWICRNTRMALRKKTSTCTRKRSRRSPRSMRRGASNSDKQGWLGARAEVHGVRWERCHLRNQASRMPMARSAMARAGAGTFSEDSRGRWYINICATPKQNPTKQLSLFNNSIAIDLGLCMNRRREPPRRSDFDESAAASRAGYSNRMTPRATLRPACMSAKACGASSIV